MTRRFRFCVFAIFLASQISACGLMRPRPKKATRVTAPKPLFVGTVTLVNEDGHFVLIDSGMSPCAALLAFPTLAGALARPGLAIYGESPLPAFQPKLARALTWKTRVVLVREVGSGRSVSYGRDFITPTPMRIATLATGYADGYPRQLSGKGAFVLIGGKRCAILGRLTMDQIMVDVTALKAMPGDEAVLIGTQGDETIPASSLAKLAGTIVWDIFTAIGPRVARLHRDGDASASKTANPA